MTLAEIAAALRERERPEKDTTYWVPVQLLQDLEEAAQDQYLLMESDSYRLSTPLRVDVKKYVPAIPDKSEEYKAQLLERFPLMEVHWYPGDPSRQGFLEHKGVKFRANLRTYDNRVHLLLDSDSITCWSVGNSVASALGALSLSVVDAEQACREARELLGMPALPLEALCSTK